MGKIHPQVPRQNTSKSVPAYIRKKALNPRRKTECTCAQMMEKSPDVQFVIRFSAWNVRSMLGK